MSLDRAEQVRDLASEQPGAAVQRLRRKGRRNRANPRWLDDEAADVFRAARLAGMTVSGWTACTAVAVARRKPPPRVAVAEATLQELAATRKQLVRVGTLLNQSVKATNASGEVAPGLPYLAGRVTVLIGELDRLTVALARKGRE